MIGTDFSNRSFMYLFELFGGPWPTWDISPQSQKTSFFGKFKIATSDHIVYQRKKILYQNLNQFLQAKIWTKYDAKFGTHIELDSQVIFRAIFEVKCLTKLYTNFFAYILDHTLNQCLGQNIWAKSLINFEPSFLILYQTDILRKGFKKLGSDLVLIFVPNFAASFSLMGNISILFNYSQP